MNGRLGGRVLHVGFVVVCLAMALDAQGQAYRHYKIRVDELTVIEQAELDASARVGGPEAPTAYATLDGSGDVYVHGDGGHYWLGVRTTSDDDVTGTLIRPPSGDPPRAARVRFRIPSNAANETAAEAFHRARLAHCERLLGQEVAGAAWFRHLARDSRVALGETPLADDPIARARRRGDNGPQDTFALFTGGRALSENLQLDRMLPLPPRAGAGADRATVDVATIDGIAVKEMDWSTRTKDLRPDLDPLARLIPADQHAVFFPSFSAMTALADEAELNGSPMLYAVEPRAQDARTKQRYERQLCLSLTGLGRLIGPAVVKSVAITGSDAYLRVGSDLAILFEAKDAASLEKLVLAQVTLARQLVREAQPVEGTVKGVAYSGARSPDRRVSSYVARLGDAAVVVTNSPAQLERLVTAHAGETPALASLPEYTFFRDRYRRGDAEETAFVMLSDATIRRWCGPRWRIADSRRTRAAALLGEVQAQYAERFATGEAASGPLAPPDLPSAAALGMLTGARGGAVQSDVYGSLEFMTPIIELPLDTVTEAERDAYVRWRDTYQENWQQFFDPIGIRLTFAPGTVRADMTVMPLILHTEYRPLISVTRDAKLTPTAGLVDGALAQVAVAVNPKSPTVDFWAAFSNNLLPGGKKNLLNALGHTVSVYAEPDPVWAELAASKSPLHFVFDHHHRFPVGLYAELIDSARMQQYLDEAKAGILEQYPEKTEWTTLQHAGQDYTRISATEKAIAENSWLKRASVYYANTGDAFIISLREEVVTRAIDRQLARRGAAAKADGAAPDEQWLGGSAALRVDAKAWDLLSLFGQNYHEMMRQRSWSNLPVLNEWRRVFPGQDPLRVHEQLWQVRPLDPAGGEYVWNEQWQTMESSVYGHPSNAKPLPDDLPLLGTLQRAAFGLTFEPDGLRLRAAVQRAPAD